MEEDRKYRQRGYMDTDRESNGSRGATVPVPRDRSCRLM